MRIKCKNKSKHRYSTYTLCLFIVLLAIGFVFALTESEDFDEVCNKDGSMFIRQDGLWQCTEDAETEEDLRFPATTLKLIGSNNLPVYSPFIGDTYAYIFDPSTMNQMFATAQLPHGRKNASDLEAHFHWSPSDGLSGDVVWCLETTCANIDQTFPSTVYGCVNQTAEGLNMHQMTQPIVLSNTLGISAMCQIRIFRNATDVKDDYANGAFLHEFDIHYKSINIGED